MKKTAALMLALTMVLTAASFPAIAADMADKAVVTGASYSGWNMDGNVAANTYDGDLTTGITVGGPKTYTFVLNGMYDLTKAELTWKRPWDGAALPAAYTISVSEDGAGGSWVKLTTDTTGLDTTTSPRTDTVELTSVQARYIKSK